MKKSGHRDPAELRRQAEEKAHSENPGQTSNIPEDRFPEEARKALYELRVSQIELEMQGEELRTTQAQLEASRGRYFDLFDLAPVGFCTISEKGMILEANLAAATLLGATRQTLVKKWLSHFIHQEDQGIYFNCCQKLFETRARQMCEIRMQPLESPSVWMKLEVTAVQDPDGVPVCLIAMSDVTVTKQAEELLRQGRDALAKRVAQRTEELWQVNEALRKSDEQSRRQLEEIQSIYGSVHVGLCVLDSRLRYVRINERMAEINGFPPAYHLGKTIQQIMPSSLTPMFNKVFERIFRTGVGLTEIEFTDDSPSEPKILRTYLGSFFPLKDKTGQVVAINVAIDDITERKHAEQQLKDLNESLERRVAEGTAEVRRLANQLRALASELTQAEQRERKRLATVLHDHIQQLLVGAQMQLSMIRRGDPRIVQTAIEDIDSTLKEALAASRSLTVELCPPVLHQSGLKAALSWLGLRMEEMHQFKVHIRADNLVESAEPETRAFLFDAVREMLLNTLKHSGILEAYLTILPITDNLCTIIVEDHGKGFAPASISPDLSGGFGLFSLQQRLLHLGGTLVIESAPGQGTKAILAIPIGQDFATTHSQPSPPNGTSEFGVKVKENPLRVLLVDDHKIMRQGLSTLLGIEPDIEIVGEAENGQHAIEQARQHNPDVVIMDVNMPVMDGIQATKILKREMPRIKVIALSMHSDKGSVNAMLEAGSAAYLTKGAPSEDLVAAIRACRPGKES